MSEAALAHEPLVLECWEKADSVLWAFTPTGIILHNFQKGAFIQLDGPEHLIWSHLDGVHSDEDIVAKLSDDPGLSHSPKAVRELLVARVLADLITGGFVARRAQ